MKRGTIAAADLFCGGGGTSTGFADACKELERPAHLVAINCWPDAIEVHKANHPWAQHVCQRIEAIRPEDLFEDAPPEGILASPECTWHSTARGGKPINDQLRSSPWVIPRWLDAFDLKWFIIENVPGFQNWGKLDAKGRPIPSLKKQIFKQYDQTLKSYGYNGEWQVLDSADYGAYTSRRRLFGLFRRGNKPIHWPTPTHNRAAANGLPKWRAARDILDFTLPTRSIFQPPYLAANTLRRIAAGALKRWGINIEPFLPRAGQRVGDPTELMPPPTGWSPDELGNAEPFLFHLTHGGREHDIRGPMPTVTGAHRGELGVVDPFLVTLRGTAEDQLAATSRGVDEPVPTVTAGGQHVGAVEPFLVGNGGPTGAGTPRSIDEPLNTILSQDRKAVVEPLILGQGGGATARPASGPLPTHHADGHIRLIQPLILPPLGFYHKEGQNEAFPVDRPLPTITQRGGQIRLLEPVVMSVDRPLTNRSLPTGSGEPIGTITGNPRLGVLEPFLVPNKSEREGQAPRHTGVDKPVPTVTATGNTGNVIQPMLVGYYGNGATHDVGSPVPAQTTKDRYGLAIPVVLSDGSHAFLDIRFRMLHWRELALAMGFPKSYNFLPEKMTKTNIVKMIGNAVETNMAKALALSQIRGRRMDVPQTSLEVAS